MQCLVTCRVLAHHLFVRSLVSDGEIEVTILMGDDPFAKTIKLRSKEEMQVAVLQTSQQMTSRVLENFVFVRNSVNDSLKIIIDCGVNQIPVSFRANEEKQVIEIRAVPVTPPALTPAPPAPPRRREGCGNHH